VSIPQLSILKNYNNVVCLENSWDLMEMELCCPYFQMSGEGFWTKLSRQESVEELLVSLLKS
jgi:hypothetical protein